MALRTGQDFNSLQTGHPRGRARKPASLATTADLPCPGTPVLSGISDRKCPIVEMIF